MDFPFTEHIEKGYYIRTFSENVNDEELVWHRDKEDRIVKSIGNTDWLIQMDNELPKPLTESVFIPKNTFHRVIKGKGDLTVRVKKLDEKTDYSKEKDKGLHGWFERQGGKGKTSGWVDCNTCRKDSKTGRKKCKPCGREKGEKRAKYPACRPTPSACDTKGKGDKWGKKNESFELIKKILLEENQKWEYQVRYIDGPIFYKRKKDSDKWSFIGAEEFVKDAHKHKLVGWHNNL
jgi:hypothetical protein